MSTVASTKLTLRLPESLIERAKAFSKQNGKSVSQIVADYLSSLPTVPASDKERRLPPVVASLFGLLKEREVEEDDYHRYLERKYL